MSETQIHGKRRAPRYHLGGVVELTDLESGRMKVALVRALSLYGCLVKTEMPVKAAWQVAGIDGHILVISLGWHHYRGHFYRTVEHDSYCDCRWANENGEHSDQCELISAQGGEITCHRK